jgi:hypothetical protein
VARGWESKSVQEQIASARERHGEQSVQLQLSAEQRNNETKRDSLLLQRTRMMRQLETCGEGRYRQTLQDGLAFLEKELQQLGWSA